MNLYFKVWWLSLVFFLLSGIFIARVQGVKTDSNILTIFLLSLLPIVDIVLQNIKKSFNPVFFVFEGRVFFLLSLLVLIFCPILIITNHPLLVEKFVLIFYALLFIGIIAQVLENTRPSRSQNKTKTKTQIPDALKNLLYQISLYFEMTNILLAPIIFIAILFTFLRWWESSQLIIYLILLIVGYIYNTFYKNTTESFFQKEHIGRLETMFILTINISIFIYLNELLQRNPMNDHIFIIIGTLLVFDLITLILWTDTIAKIHIKYRSYLKN